MPASAPNAASTRLSVSSCRATRQRLAPRAMRTLSSLLRAVARASCRLATFAPTIRNSTKQTAIRIRSGASSKACIPRCAFHTGTRLAWKPLLVFGDSSARRRAQASTSASACSNVTPGFSRAVTHICRSPRSSSSHVPWPFSSGAMLMGIQISIRMPGIVPRNSSGAMPATVSSYRFTRMVLPTTRGSPWNRLRQSPALMTATGAAPELSPDSDGRNARPRIGFTPSVAK